MTRAILLVLALAGCATTPVEAPAPPRSVIFASEVAQSFFEIQREYEVETMRCLTGFVTGDTVFVYGATPSWIDYQTPYAVQFRTCTAPETVGWYHNHPRGTGADGEPVYDCSVSDRDVATTRSIAHFWLAVLTCDDQRTLVWRFKGEQADHRHTLSAYQFSSGRVPE